jgi:hypothetical protein
LGGAFFCLRFPHQLRQLGDIHHRNPSRASSLLSNLAARLAAPAHMHMRANYSIREPIVAIGDREDLLACFANGLSRRSNMVTNDLVNGVTNRTGIQRGGYFGRHHLLVRESQARLYNGCQA